MSAVDQVFAERVAGWTEIHVPLPPSVNDFVRNLGNRSPRVVKWIKAADMHYVMTRPHPPCIAGAYEADFMFNREHAAGPSDLDNRIKPLMDWLQRVRLIENDRYCEKIVATWGPAPKGCRVRLRAWAP